MATRLKNPESNEEPTSDMIEISVKLTSGKFESTIRLPLASNKEKIEAALGNWWETLESVIRCNSGKQVEITKSG